MSWDVVVIGAGAAGLLAAASAAEQGARTVLVEKNRKAGVKILMSGGTRCNVTHNTDARGIVTAFGEQGPFLHSALAHLGPREVVGLFEREGVATKVESTGKVFPVSDRAIDVRDALVRLVLRAGVRLLLGEPVRSIGRMERLAGGEVNPQPATGSGADVDSAEGFAVRTEHDNYETRALIITSGGQSYPGCGTTGDGYVWATKLGHGLVPPRPALTPLTSPASWVHALSGVTIPDIQARIQQAPVQKASRNRSKSTVQRGGFLFTHVGLSGPVPMNLSKHYTENGETLLWPLECDFVPDESAEELDRWLEEESRRSGKRLLSVILGQKLPRRLAEIMLEQQGLPIDRTAAALAKSDRLALVQAMKGLAIPISGTLGFPKAEVTAGGVPLAEVDSRSLASKRVPGLFWAGEILDLDGPIGGFNFQSAFSTGSLAGVHAARYALHRK